MKKIVLLLLLPAAILVAGSCKKEKESGRFDLFVHLHHNFLNDVVQVYVDGEEKLNAAVTTNPSLGFAGGISASKTGGMHWLKIVVNGNHSETKLLSLTQDLYVGVSYDEQQHIGFVVSNTPFVYD